MPRALVDLVRKTSVLVLLAGLAACQAADGTSQAPDIAVVGSLMRGLGAVDPKAEPIDYKPRAPLAMPAEPTNLPEPETKVAGTQPADWPQQQENTQLNEIKQLYATPGQDPRAPLTPEQMRGFKITGVTGTRERDLATENRSLELMEGGVQTRAEQQAEWERLQKLKAQKTGIDQSGLATRRYLVDPPTSYSTPSPDAPMPQVVKQEKKGGYRDPYDTKPLDPRCMEGDTTYCN